MTMMGGWGTGQGIDCFKNTTDLNTLEWTYTELVTFLVNLVRFFSFIGRSHEVGAMLIRHKVQFRSRAEVDSHTF